MRSLRLALPAALAACLLCPPSGVFAQSAPASDADAIKAVLQRSTDDWNRGDLDAFAACYKHSPNILFIGKTISRGYDGMLKTYREHYGTKEKMGKLSFSQVEVQPLDAKFATVTGQFHLERTSAGGGDADGYYLLVLEKTSAGWKIVRDDSTVIDPAAAK